MIRVLVYALPILLAIYALIDCIQTDESEIRGLPKFGWIILIVFIGVVGPIAWLVAGRTRNGRSLLPGLPTLGGRNSGGPTERPRTIAPDDDPEFLGRLGTQNSYDRQLDEWEEDLRRSAGENPPGAPDDEDPDEGPDSDVPAR